MSSTGNDGPPARQDLLADVLAGTRSADDEAVRAACQDPRFARLLGELQSLQDRIGRAKAVEHAALAGPPSAIDDRIAAAVRAAQPARRWPGGLRGPWRAWLAVAAALLVGAAVVWFWPSGLPQDYLLGEGFRIEVAPEYARVGWQGSPGAFWFRVTVRDENGRDIDRSDLLKANTWTPTEAVRWPDRVVVTVALVDAGDDERATDRVVADRKGTRR